MVESGEYCLLLSLFLQLDKIKMCTKKQMNTTFEILKNEQNFMIKMVCVCGIAKKVLKFYSYFEMNGLLNKL